MTSISSFSSGVLGPRVKFFVSKKIRHSKVCVCFGLIIFLGGTTWVQDARSSTVVKRWNETMETSKGYEFPLGVGKFTEITLC